MKRNSASYTITGFPTIKEQMLYWVSGNSFCSFLDNQGYSSVHQSYDCLAAAGALRIFNGPDGIQQINQFTANEKDWLFGHISFDAFNTSTTTKDNPVGFNTLSFFQPETVLQLDAGHLIIQTTRESPESIFREIIAIDVSAVSAGIKLAPVKMIPRISREEYISTVKKLKAHIQRGDCYELNFCQEFFSENVTTDCLSLYKKLSALSPNPFSCYYRQWHAHLACASPERFLRRKGNNLISQPIKGTKPRNTKNSAADHVLREELFMCSKERAENVMIVDLVRNDLSKICKEGTVEVEELFGIYSFPQVHQMISTVKGEIDPTALFSDIIAATFPMGSMTGAPKKKVLELIHQYEPVSRGLFSGAVGYIDPDNNFDFNVVIRSLLYNAASKYLSYQVGSGITHYCNPEDEYEECLLKALALNAILEK